MDASALDALSLLQALHRVRNDLSGMEWPQEQLDFLLSRGWTRPFVSQQIPSQLIFHNRLWRHKEKKYEGWLKFSRCISLQRPGTIDYGFGVVDLVWEFELMWGTEDFLIETSIVVSEEFEIIHLRQFADRHTQTLDDCLRHLKEASEELASSTGLLSKILSRLE